MPDEVETMSKWSEVLQSILHLIQEIIKWEVLVPTLFVSFTLLVICQIPLVRIILDGMYTIVNITIALVCLLSISGILYKLAYTLFAKISIIRQQHEATNAIQHQLQRLSTQERVIMDIALSGGNCGVWMPRTNAAVLTLLHKGLLVRISEEETFADWENERELCTLMIIPEAVQNILDT